MYFSFELLMDIDIETVQVLGSQMNVKRLMAMWLAVRKNLVCEHLWKTWQLYTWH